MTRLLLSMAVVTLIVSGSLGAYWVLGDRAVEATAEYTPRSFEPVAANQEEKVDAVTAAKDESALAPVVRTVKVQSIVLPGPGSESEQTDQLAPKPVRTVTPANPPSLADPVGAASIIKSDDRIVPATGSESLAALPGGNDTNAYAESRQEDTPFPDLPRDRAIVAVDNLNMRDAPDLKAGIVGRFAVDTEVEVLERREAWLKVFHKDTDKTGWMHGDYLNEDFGGQQ